MRKIKESSDELDPRAAVVTGDQARPAAARSGGDYLALVLATCGVGYLPLAPGTWGSAVGVGIYLLWRSLSRQATLHALASGWTEPAIDACLVASALLVLLLLSLAGVWAASRAETLLGRKDPGEVVIDEVAGQLLTFLSLPRGAGWWAVGAGFLFFRAFDIWKPYPVRRLERLESGLGIMADDILAGAYAAASLAVVLALYSVI